MKVKACERCIGSKNEVPYKKQNVLSISIAL